MALRSDLHGQELVAVKDGRSAETLRHEAALLSDLDHPGIIRFVALTNDERGPRLLTRYAGRETLATWQPQRLEELRRVVEDLAGIVGYLHERGVVHRSIRPSHVVIDALRRPLLCGFSSAGRVAVPGGTATNRPGIPCRAEGNPADHEPEPPAAGGESEQDAGVGTAGEQLADVVAIGETVLAALQRLEGQRTRPSRRKDDPRLRERLHALAQAAAGGRVPTAKALAGQIHALGTGGGTTRAPGNGADGKLGVSEFAAGASGADDSRGRSAHPGSGTPGASSVGTDAAPGSGTEGLHRQPEDVLRGLRTPAAHRSGQRRHLLDVRPRLPNRHPGQAPRRLRHVRPRPRKATLLAVVAVCGGCVLGTLMVMRLGATNAPPPAPVGSDPLAGSTTVTAGAAGRGGAAPESGPAVHPSGAAAAEPPASPDSAPVSRPTPSGQTPADHSGVAPAPPLPPHDTAGCRPIADGFRDVTGDGCAEEIDLTAGFVWVDGTPYPIGEAGDQVAVGDWDCDGIATVALVQSGGRVYVFDSWPRQSPLVGRLVADLTPPVQLAGVPRGACNELLVRYAEGTWYLPLPVPSQ